jgi:hypothetical protein
LLDSNSPPKRKKIEIAIFHDIFFLPWSFSSEKPKKMKIANKSQRWFYSVFSYLIKRCKSVVLGNFILIFIPPPPQVKSFVIQSIKKVWLYVHFACDAYFVYRIHFVYANALLCIFFQFKCMFYFYIFYEMWHKFMV